MATISYRRRSHKCRRNEWVRTEWVRVTKEFWYRLIFLSLHTLNIFAYSPISQRLSVRLGFLWLDVKIDKKTIVIFFIPDNEISNSVKVFSLLRALRRAATLFLTGFLCSARTVLSTSGDFRSLFFPSHTSILWMGNDDPLNTKYFEISGNTYCKQRQNGKFHVTSRVSIHQGDNRLSDVSRGRQCPHWGKPIKRSTFWSTNKLSVAYEGD